MWMTISRSGSSLTSFFHSGVLKSIPAYAFLNPRRITLYSSFGGNVNYFNKDLYVISENMSELFLERGNEHAGLQGLTQKYWGGIRKRQVKAAPRIQGM